MLRLVVVFFFLCWIQCCTSKIIDVYLNGSNFAEIAREEIITQNDSDDIYLLVNADAKSQANFEKVYSIDLSVKVLEKIEEVINKETVALSKEFQENNILSLLSFDQLLPEKGPRCPVCEKSFKTRNFINNHLNRIHVHNLTKENTKIIYLSDACRFIACEPESNLTTNNFHSMSDHSKLHLCAQFFHEHIPVDQLYFFCKGVISSSNLEDLFNQEGGISVLKTIFIIFFILGSLAYAFIAVEAYFTQREPVIRKLYND